MNEPPGMSVGQTASRLRDHRRGRYLVERAIPQDLPPQIDAIDELRNQKVDLPVMASIEGIHEIAMIERRDVLDLTAKSRFGLRIGTSSRQHLHRHDPPHQEVLGLKDLPHAALAHGIENAVLAQGQFALTSQQLVGLKAGQRALVNQGCREDVVFALGGSGVRQPATHLGRGCLQISGGHQPAGNCRAGKRAWQAAARRPPG